MKGIVGMKNRGAQLSIAFICVILGVMISLQFKSVTKNTAQNGIQKQRTDVLQGKLTEAEARNEDLNKQVQQYQKELSSYEQTAAKSSDQSKALLTQLENAKVLAGMTDVQGSGVEVKLNDSKVKNDKTDKLDQNYFLIHDDDILKVVKELTSAGAEAISVNGERLVATSAIRCAGNLILVNQNSVAPPFIIQAVGNPDKLESGLEIRGGVVDILKEWNIDIEIKKVDNLVIPRYAGTINFQYAKPAVNKEGK